MKCFNQVDYKEVSLPSLCSVFFLLAVGGLRRKGTSLAELINFCICMGEVPMAR